MTRDPGALRTRLGRWLGVAVAFASAALALAALFAIGSTFADDFVLDLGSIHAPAPRYAFFLTSYVLLGGGAVLALATAGMQLWRPVRDAGPLAWIRSGSDARWIGAGAIAAFLVPLLIRSVVLGGAPLTDDESAYRFMAELLASGRLYADSHADKLFFDRAFMINDGRLYAKYFLGWPALMVPGIWLGVAGAMNALYAAAAVPAVFALLRRAAGSSWARVGLILYASSPLFMIGAATGLAHTSCVCALAWTLHLALRAREPDAPAWIDAALAVAFTVAFFIRPPAALAIGAPALVLWGLGVWRGAPAGGSERARAQRLALFAAPAVVGAALFLGANVAQHGAAFTTGYARELQYAVENGFRFTNVRPEELAQPPEFDLSQPWFAQLANTASAVLRLNFALFGWPCSLLFVAFALVRRRTSEPAVSRCVGLAWASLGVFFALHFYTHNAGIDSFAPVHFYEAALPLLILTAAGLARATDWLASEVRSRDGQTPHIAALPATLAAASVVIAAVAFAPVRLGALARVADNVRMPFESIEAAGVSNAVVFASRPFAPPCRSAPTNHFVFWRPNNDPDLNADVLWANHIDVIADRALMARFPDRSGWVMLWTHACEVHLIPLEHAAPGSIPRGYVGGDAEATRARNPRGQG